MTVLSAGTLYGLGWVLWSCGYGFDFTDESHHLIWMQRPFSYRFSTWQFGFLFHPLYQTLDGDIAALRRINVLLTFATGWLFGYLFLRDRFAAQGVSVARSLILGAAIATLALCSFSLWPVVPCYNSLNLQAMLLTLSGLMLAQRDATFAGRNAWGWSLIALGGLLSFLARPPTAALLAPVCCIYLMVTRKLRLHPLLMALAIVLVGILASALLIDGSVPAFIARIKGGATMSMLGDARYRPENLFRLERLPIPLTMNEWMVFILLTLALAGLTFCATQPNRFAVVIRLCLAFGFAVLMPLFMISELGRAVSFERYWPLIPWVVPLAAALTGSTYRFKEGSGTLRREEWTLIGTLFVMPYCLLIGSNVNHWMMACCSAGVFWVFCGLVWLRRIPSSPCLQTALTTLCAATLLTAMFFIHQGVSAPRRQPASLMENDTPFAIGGPHSTVILHREAARYLTEVLAAAERAGFRTGSPMIDLTGQSPGVLYALGAESLGQAWLVGGYPGSNARALFALRQVDCPRLASAWILYEPKGPRILSPEVPLSFGADMASHFAKVGSFFTGSLMGERMKGRWQYLLKPIRDQQTATAACETMRARARS